MSRTDAGATRSRAISCRHATPDSKLGKTTEPYLRQSGIGLIFIVTSVTTPSVPADGASIRHQCILLKTNSYISPIQCTALKYNIRLLKPLSECRAHTIKLQVKNN